MPHGIRKTIVSSRFDSNRQHRRTNRLPVWDYRWPGAYFVTICTHERAPLFDEGPLREIAASVWYGMPERYRAGLLALDEWVVMPDHFHGIIVLDGAWPQIRSVEPLNPDKSATSLQNAAAGSLGAIIGSYKSLVSRRVNQHRRTISAPVWQRGFYERVLRTPEELDRTRIYVRDNPVRWAVDHGMLDADLEHMDLHS